MISAIINNVSIVVHILYRNMFSVLLSLNSEMELWSQGNAMQNFAQYS